MQDYYITLKEFKQGGFDIIVDKTWEDLSLKNCFDDTCYDIADMQRKINNHELDWFMLRVRVMLDGHEMAGANLGGCLYENAKDILTDGTADDLIFQAMQDAEDEVRRLRNRLDQLVIDSPAE
jgi:hypothetical protein